MAEYLGAFVGKVVMYKKHSYQQGPTIQPAIITSVVDIQTKAVNIFVFNESTNMVLTNVPFDETGEIDGSWSWA